MAGLVFSQRLGPPAGLEKAKLFPSLPKHASFCLSIRAAPGISRRRGRLSLLPAARPLRGIHRARAARNETAASILMAIIFVNRFYWPDEPATAQLLTDLAESLAAAGNEVAVIASRNRKLKAPREEVRRGVRICRVGGTRFGEKNLIGRAVDFLIFSLGALL